MRAVEGIFRNTRFSSISSTRHRIPDFLEFPSGNKPFLSKDSFRRTMWNNDLIMVETTLISRRDEIQPRRTMIRYVGQFTEQIARRIRGRLPRILSRSVDSLNSISLSLSLRVIHSRTPVENRSLSDRSPLTRRGRIVWKMVGTAFLRKCPSRQCSIHVPFHRFTESRFTQCYVTLATHLSFEAVRTPRIVHHVSLTLFSLPRPLTDPPLLLCAQFLKITCRRKKKEEDKEESAQSITSGRNKSCWTKNDGREREKTEKRQLAFDVLTERARRRRRSRLFRNDDAPASRIAEGLHCASAARASSTQPPRASSSLLRNRRSNTFAQPRVRVPGSLEYGWGARMRMRAPTCVARVSIARSLCIVPPPISSFFLFFRHFFSSYFSSAIVPLSLSHSFVFFPLSRFPFERREDDGRFDGRVRERTNPIMNYTGYV